LDQSTVSRNSRRRVRALLEKPSKPVVQMHDRSGKKIDIPVPIEIRDRVE
jgi:hypothetical protein